MPDYKGIPFDGGLDSPSGTGAQQLVDTLKAIIDFLLDCTTPGQFEDGTGQQSIDIGARVARNASSQPTLNWGTAALIDPNTSDQTLNWENSTLNAAGNIPAVSWGSRELIDSSGGNVLLIWDNGLRMPGLPTSDPGVPGQLWNNSGTLSVSP